MEKPLLAIGLIGKQKGNEEFILHGLQRQQISHPQHAASCPLRLAFPSFYFFFLFFITAYFLPEQKKKQLTV